jgi:hypothetical protein
MPLPPGTRLGPYEVLIPLGAGGMGEVYKARDTRLDRTVAIKVLPADLAADVEFRARFDREAKTISQLNHPQISSTQPSVPAALEYIVRTCLEKDPELRFQSAHDLLLQLRWIAETGLIKTADHHTYAVTNDGKRFLISVADQPQGPVPITVALNWLALVKR